MIRSGLFFLCLSGAAALSAQTPAVKLDDVVVTSRPVDVFSFAATTVVLLGGLPLADNTMGALSDRAANFFVASNDARSFNDTFALRGLVNTPIFGDPAVTFYLDDLPLGSGFTVPDDLTGFARAELHRGPGQNTLFGRAGSAGVVTLHTPGLGAAPQSELRVGLGDHGARRFSASVGTASGGAADAWVGVNAAARDGYITNLTLDRKIDNRDSRGALARVHWRPSAATELTVLVTAARARDGVQPLVPLGGPFFTVERPSEGRAELTVWNVSFTAAGHAAGGRWNATTSHGDWDLSPYTSTLAFGPLALVNRVTQRQLSWNEELKFTADPRAKVPWSAGAFYADAQTDGQFERQFDSFAFESSRFRTGARSAAVFGEASYAVNSAMEFTAGMRLENSRKQLRRAETIPTAQAFALREDSSAWLPKLGVSYAPGDGARWFAGVGAGFKPGGFSAFTGNRALAAFGPERTRTIEGGVTRSLGQALTVTARGFFYDITGYQIERSFATGAVADDYLVVNAAHARSGGAELELTWRPAADVTLTVDLGGTRVTLREFTDPYTGVSYAGKRAPAVPLYDASVRAEYRPARGFFLAGELSANGRVFYTEGEDAVFSQGGVALWSARAGYTVGNFRFILYGANLADRRYYRAITPGTGHGTPGAPRTHGVEVQAKF